MNNDELWSIRLPSGDIRQGTIDQLDEAFHSGAITSMTQVLPPGEATWTTLGEAAGLEDAPPAPAVARAAAAPVVAVVPMAAQPVAYAPSGPCLDMDQIPAAHSLRPFTSDFDDVEYAPKARGGAKRAVMGVIGLAAVAGIAALGVTLSRQVGSTAAAGTPPVAAITSPTPYVTPTVDVAVPTESGNPMTAIKLADDPRKGMPEASKGGGSHASSFAHGPRSSGKAGKGSDPFATGNSKGKCQCSATDPLCGC